jgi:hypothetical protein
MTNRHKSDIAIGRAHFDPAQKAANSLVRLALIEAAVLCVQCLVLERREDLVAQRSSSANEIGSHSTGTFSIRPMSSINASSNASASVARLSRVRLQRYRLLPLLPNGRILS